MAVADSAKATFDRPAFRLPLFLITTGAAKVEPAVAEAGASTDLTTRSARCRFALAGAATVSRTSNAQPSANAPRQGEHGGAGGRRSGLLTAVSIDHVRRAHIRAAPDVTPEVWRRLPDCPMTVRRIMPYHRSADFGATRAFSRRCSSSTRASFGGGFIGFGFGQAQVVFAPPDVEAPLPDMGVDVASRAAVDAAHAKAVEAGHAVLYGPVDEPWGVRRFFVRDPDGVVISVLAHD